MFDIEWKMYVDKTRNRKSPLPFQYKPLAAASPRAASRLQTPGSCSLDVLCVFRDLPGLWQQDPCCRS